MTNKIKKIDHWWPYLLKNMSMIFNFEFGWFMLQVHVWPCCATSARDADPNQNRTRLGSWTLNCLNNFVSNVHSVRSRCNISLFCTSDDITIFWMFPRTITKLWIRSTTKFNKYPAMRCHWRASRFPCALLRSRHCWKVQVPLRRLSSFVAPSAEGAVMKYPSIAELIPTSRSW